MNWVRDLLGENKKSKRKLESYQKEKNVHKQNNQLDEKKELYLWECREYQPIRQRRPFYNKTKGKGKGERNAKDARPWQARRGSVLAQERGKTRGQNICRYGNNRRGRALE
jgi:Tfp pilus assembly protein PilP